MAEKETSEARRDSAVNKDDAPKKARFHFLKSSAFRTIHADGVFGGVTPRLTIAATFFNERSPIPDQTAHNIKEDGTLGDEILEERIVSDGLVRELEANVVIDVEFAKVLVTWLNDKIAFIEKKIEEAKEEQAREEKKKETDHVAG